MVPPPYGYRSAGLFFASRKNGPETDRQVHLRFRDIHFSVDVSKVKAALMGGQPGVKHILKGLSGAVESGQILAIIGSSGAGKTSLLDVLVGKVRSSASYMQAGNLQCITQRRLCALFRAVLSPEEVAILSPKTNRP